MKCRERRIAITFVLIMIVSIMAPYPISPVQVASADPGANILEDQITPSPDTTLSPGETYTFDVTVDYWLDGADSATLTLYFESISEGAEDTVEVSQQDGETTLTGTVTIPSDWNTNDDLSVLVLIEGPNDRDTDNVLYDVSSPNNPPSIDDFSPSDTTLSVSKGGSIDFSVSASDSDPDDTLSYDWYVDSGSGYQHVDTGTSYTRTFDNTGTQFVRVDVNDGTTTVSQKWHVDVQEENQDRPPSISRLSPTSSSITVSKGNDQLFEVEVSDADHDLDALEWYVDGSNVNTLFLGGSETQTDSRTYTFDDGGTHTVEAVVNDSNGNSDSLSWTVSVETTPPSVSTAGSSGVAATEATITGDLTDLGTADSVDVRFRYRKDGASSWQQTAWVSRSGTGSFSETITNLAESTTYEFQAQARSADGSVSGGTNTFTTKTPPSVSTGSASGIGESIATLEGSLDSLGSGNSATVWFEYREQGDSTWQKTAGQSMSSIGSFSREVSGLNSGTTYEVRAVAETSVDRDHGTTRTFETEAPLGGNVGIIDEDTTPAPGTELTPGETYSFDVRVYYDISGTDSATIGLVFESISADYEETATVTSGEGHVTLSDSLQLPSDWNTNNDLEVSVVAESGTGDILDTDTVRYPVTSSNTPPQIDQISPSDTTLEFTTGDSMEFSISASDPDDDTLTYEWYLDAGGGYELEATGQTYSTTFEENGTYFVRADIFDGNTTVTQKWIVEVEPVNEDRNPTITRVSPSSNSISISNGTERTFEVEVTDLDQDLDRVDWSVNGTVEHTRHLGGDQTQTESWTYRFETGGSKTVTAQVVDSNGNTDSVRWTVYVDSTPDLRIESVQFDRDPPIVTRYSLYAGAGQSGDLWGPSQGLQAFVELTNEGESDTAVRVKWAIVDDSGTVFADGTLSECRGVGMPCRPGLGTWVLRVPFSHPTVFEDHPEISPGSYDVRFELQRRTGSLPASYETVDESTAEIEVRPIDGTPIVDVPKLDVDSDSEPEPLLGLPYQYIKPNDPEFGEWIWHTIKWTINAIGAYFSGDCCLIPSLGPDVGQVNEMALNTAYTSDERPDKGSLTIHWQNIHQSGAQGDLAVRYDRAVITARVPDSVEIMDDGGADYLIHNESAGAYQLVWVETEVDKGIESYGDAGGQYTIEIGTYGDEERTVTVDYSLRLELGPLRGPVRGYQPFIMQTDPENIEYVYDYEKWQSSPQEVYWMSIGATKDRARVTAPVLGPEPGSPPPAIVGGLPPTDPDGDGLYEDLNGNGRADYQDIVLLANHLNNPKVNEYLWAYDFNDNGRVGSGDFIRLFHEV